MRTNQEPLTQELQRIRKRDILEAVDELCGLLDYHGKEDRVDGLVFAIDQLGASEKRCSDLGLESSTLDEILTELERQHNAATAMGFSCVVEALEDLKERQNAD